jgi:hypothetical protein
MKKLWQRIKDNWQTLFGVLVGLVIGGFSLELWAKLNYLTYGTQMQYLTNQWQGIMSLLALVGLAFLLYRAVLIILWIIEKACKIISKDGAENAEK